jgi:IS6 family transposase
MNPFKHRHSLYDIIIWAVRWYSKYGISYRQQEDILSERGADLDHTAIYR